MDPSRVPSGSDAVGERLEFLDNLTSRFTAEMVADLVGRLDEVLQPRDRWDTVGSQCCCKLVGAGVGTGCRSQRQSGMEGDTAPN
jgi:hypothetical protein